MAFHNDMTQKKSDMSPISAQLFAKQPLAESVLGIFDHLPQIILYAKDCEDRYIRVNKAYLDLHGYHDESQVIGKTTYDLNPPALAKAYVAEDRMVMDSGKALPSQRWVVMHHSKTPFWLISSKAPLIDPQDNIVGLFGVMYRVEAKEEIQELQAEIHPVIQHIEQHYMEPVSMVQMAELAGLSTTHFNRRFRQLMHMTPNQYLRLVRVQVAQNLLTTSDRAIADISYDVGYSDQSHLTKRFKEVTGITPAAYRKRFM